MPFYRSRQRWWSPRRGSGLLEVAIVGTFSAVLIGVLATYRDRGAVEEVGPQATARRLAVDLYQIERRAARQGIQFTIEFSPTPAPDRYTIFSRQHGQNEVEAIRHVAADTKMHPSCQTLHFDNHGRPDTACVVRFDDGHRQHTVTLDSTGSVRLQLR